jgi:hypothetical protein
VLDRRACRAPAKCGWCISTATRRAPTRSRRRARGSLEGTEREGGAQPMGKRSEIVIAARVPRRARRRRAQRRRSRALAAGGKLGSIARDFAARVRELDLAALDRGGADAGGIGRGLDAGEAGAAVPEEQADPGQPELDPDRRPPDAGEPTLLELEAATERFSDPEGEGVKQQAESLESTISRRQSKAARTRAGWASSFTAPAAKCRI